MAGRSGRRERRRKAAWLGSALHPPIQQSPHFRDWGAACRGCLDFPFLEGNFLHARGNGSAPTFPFASSSQCPLCTPKSIRICWKWVLFLGGLSDFLGGCCVWTLPPSFMEGGSTAALSHPTQPPSLHPYQRSIKFAPMYKKWEIGALLVGCVFFLNLLGGRAKCP